MYMLVFTCLNIRHCHIELIPEMTTEQFVMALIRFCNEYGIPSTIYSDNALSFISGVNVMDKVFTSSLFQQKFGAYDIKHVRIPVYSPWFGATWERSIRTIKSCLRKTISREKLDYFQLKTVLSDIQVAVNSRPLTYRCASDDGLEILTPNKFLRPQVEANIIVKQPQNDLVETANRKNLVKSLSIREKMISKFNKIWYESYLLSLRSLYKDLHQTGFSNQIRVDDLVLIKHPTRARQHWRLGRVSELIYGSDNKVRSAKVLRGDSKYTSGKRTLELHSIKNLYPLELNITHNHVVKPPTGTQLSDLEEENLVEDDEQSGSQDSSDSEESDESVNNMRVMFHLDDQEINSLTNNSEQINSVPKVSTRGRLLREPERLTYSN